MWWVRQCNLLQCGNLSYNPSLEGLVEDGHEVWNTLANSYQENMSTYQGNNCTWASENEAVR